VPRQEHLAGTATLRCLVCKNVVAVPAPLPFPQSFFHELARSLRLYGLALKGMGWWKLALTLLIWIGGTAFIMVQLSWPDWLAVLLPGLPFMYFFVQELAPRSRAQLRAELGVLRVPASLKGMSERDPLLVRNAGEVEKIVASRPCPVCEGNFEILDRRLVLPRGTVEQLKFKLTRKASRMFERVSVRCRNCSNQGNFYFDISQTPQARKLGFTDELMKQYPKKKA
jgi:hypothetical protein